MKTFPAGAPCHPIAKLCTVQPGSGADMTYDSNPSVVSTNYLADPKKSTPNVEEPFFC
jgi:hypothetical protein